MAMEEDFVASWGEVNAVQSDGGFTATFGVNTGE